MASLPNADDAAPPHDRRWADDKFTRLVRQKLCRWFDQNARTLSWRSDPTPYRVWISEVMLQQTQVATVVPYFLRFLEAFPDVRSLADADESDLMRHWEGLGYYRRARSMHAAAKQIVAQHDGVFPTDFQQVLALPGIGRYTAGAVLSISRDQRHPILEGNTQRVFSRWIAMRAPVSDPPATKLLWRVAQAMLPAKSGSGKFNQAAMELGALVCTPRSPTCDRCPVSQQCAAHQAGLQDQIPAKKPKIIYEDRREYAFVIAEPQVSDPAERMTRRYLMRVLPKGVRWSGLWDFPRTVDRSIDAVETASEEVSRMLGCKLLVGDRLMQIKHAVTKYRIKLSVHAAQFESDLLAKDLSSLVGAGKPWKFVSAAEMASLPLSVTGRKIAKRLTHEAVDVRPVGISATR